MYNNAQLAVASIQNIFWQYGLQCIHCSMKPTMKHMELEMWANAQRDGCPAKYRWRPLFNAAKSG